VELIGYIRVSRVGGREGDSFISPEVQRERLHGYAKAHGHTVIVTISDLDESGGKLNRPGFQDALARCEAGDAQGIIVAKLDRFARSLADAVASIQRLERAGCQLVSVADNLDTTTSTGKFARTMLLAIAELERERITESWDVAREKAIARGVHATSRPPVGYRVEPDGTLLPDPVTAPIVREAFEQRAAGATITEIGRLLDSVNGRTFTNSAVRYLLGCRTYLGEVRSGEYVKTDAHEPLVGLALFAAANARKPVAATRRDSTADGMLLSGLIRCATCRHAMSVGRNGHKTHPVETYRCKVVHAGGNCPAPASISARRIEVYVAGFAMGVSVEQRSPSDVILGVYFDPQHPDRNVDVDALQAALAAAESELTDYVTTMKAGDPGFRVGYESRVAALNVASADLANGIKTQAARGLFDWPSLNMDERRRILRSKFQAVFVRQGRGTPVQDRVRAVWQFEPAVELPRRGVTSVLPPFEW
jgi:DNA invertase Pin-like site-specific DNA recombinase